MFDIWGFLLQTLNVSGAAMVLLLIKELFRDKLPPKWHFAVWGILGLILLIPAGLDGRYALFHWPLLVEIIKSWFGDFRFTQVLFPIPILFGENTGIDLFTLSRQMILEWIFVGYVLGVVVSGLKYIVSYIRLRMVLRNGQEVSEEKWAHIHQLAWRYFGTEYLGTKKFGKNRFKLGKVVEIQGLPSAFVCGIFRPILVLPADEEVDDKIILHELSHMKYKDTLWTVIICFWRCIHWCNPFLVYCANRALNDMEARCDQNVLELLEGEERRDYGRILLSMANDKYAKTPGSTCINNGGRNIRERIEAIARFKKYPVGMRLVSVCAILMLTLFLTVGVQATEMHEFRSSVKLTMASARSIPCTTFAGAFDTYAKAIFEEGNGYYRAMCAPQLMQEEILKEMLKYEKLGCYSKWDNGLSSWADSLKEYYVYNLKQVEENAYEGFLVLQINYMPDHLATPDMLDGKIYVAFQKLRAQEENGRWVIYELEEFQYAFMDEAYGDLKHGCEELPSFLYTGTAKNMQVDIYFQTIHIMDNSDQDYFTIAPKPDGVFTECYNNRKTVCTHLGMEEERENIMQIGVSAVPIYKGYESPEFSKEPIEGNMEGGGSDGTIWSSRETESGWGPTLRIGGGGSGYSDTTGVPVEMCPDSYAAKLHINKELYAEMNLYLQEGAESK